MATDGHDVDLLVVGGGINGVGIARDAVGRGLSVLLCEQDDLAGHTSSASTKLIHGGLRYLEQYEFSLVGKALTEREVLLRAAPHIIWPLRFVLPHEPHLRPAWMIRVGMWLYDRLGQAGDRRLLPRSDTVHFPSHAAGAALKPHIRRAFVYSDAWTQDARMVVLNAMDARARGATVRTRTRCVRAARQAGHWQVELRDRDGNPTTVRARALANAAGPWAGRFLDEVAHVRHPHQVHLVKGSHIVVPRLFDHGFAYIFQQPDRRIVFAIPYERDYTLVGTTDVEYDGDPARVAIDDDERRYLCDAANRYFRQQIGTGDIVWAYSGVRPLLGDDASSASEATRDYRIELDHDDGAPLLNVFGGKLTTYRKLGEEAVDRLAPLLGCEAGPWTGDDAPLPGGDMPDADFDRFHRGFRERFAWLPEDFALRLARNYGTLAGRVLDGARSLDDLGQHFGADLYAAEVDYLVREEWAHTAEDILWRRSKLGLRLDQQGVAALEAHLARAAAPA
ncbi:glycerol-3-phosphate dehydrogenase [Coralloluteibacterium stylophorae]|uniref:Glycerol-3-phosphate dehydrogenase n=2 Tax=Coralloluteibacterium stylophorae TaxID=1776034 RepID=A0AAP2CCY3_9GAMM|nr:glycerol-3-phosphate dehydrogenase [Coralloluteibacterium stylophorae]MBS7458603.1 glycerol-3-phosphate dehydrogenase [Coralloluteibacterium stylophorae]